MIIILVGRKFLKGEISTRTQRKVQKSLGACMVSLEVMFQIVMIRSGSYDQTFDMPLHLCSLMVLVGGISLLFNIRFMMRLLALPLVGGPALALATPFMPEGSPLIRQVYFFVYHIELVSAGMFIMWVLKETVNGYTILRSASCIVGLGFLSIWYNGLTGGNYLFTATPIADVPYFHLHMWIYRISVGFFITMHLTLIYVLCIKLTSVRDFAYLVYGKILKKSHKYKRKATTL